MRFKKLMCYGVDESLPNDMQYINKIRIENYKNPESVVDMMDALSESFVFYQYNSDGLKAKDCDYFSWNYVDDNGNNNYQTIDISIYDENIMYHANMLKLLNEIDSIILSDGIDVNIVVYYDSVENLVSDIKKSCEHYV